MIKWEQIKLVVFDLDGTLYAQTPVRICMFFELLFCCSVTRAGLKKILAINYFRKKYELFSMEHRLDAYHSAIEITAKNYGLKIEDFSSIIDEWLIDRPLKYIRIFRLPGIDITFARLKKLGIKIAIFSNHPTEKKLRH